MTLQHGLESLDPAVRTSAPISHEPAQRVLLVDDESFIRNLCRHTLADLGLAYTEAADGHEALEAVANQSFDLVLLDIDMPGMSGWEVCRRLRLIPERTHLKVILVSGRSHPDELASMLLSGANDFLMKPFTAVQLRARVQAALMLKRTQERSDRYQRDLLRVNRELEGVIEDRDSDLVEARNALVLALAKLVECRDTETGAHLQRLQAFSRRLAEEAIRQPSLSEQIDQDFIDLLACCAPLHDIGKVGLPDQVLLKPGKLTAEERLVMETHTVLGATTLRQVAQRHGFALAFLEMSIDIARHHHERFDGGGYPDRLQADAIPLSARIVAVCDVYDAMRSPRCYKPALPHGDVVAHIAAGRGAHFDPLLTESFLRCSAEFDHIYAELSD